MARAQRVRPGPGPRQQVWVGISSFSHTLSRALCSLRGGDEGTACVEGVPLPVLALPVLAAGGGCQCFKFKLS